MKRMEMRETEEEKNKKHEGTKHLLSQHFGFITSWLAPPLLPLSLMRLLSRRALAVFLYSVRPRLSLEMPQKPHTHSSTTPKKVFTHPPQKKGAHSLPFIITTTLLDTLRMAKQQT